MYRIGFLKYSTVLNPTLNPFWAQSNAIGPIFGPWLPALNNGSGLGVKIQFQMESNTCVVWKSYGQKVLEFSSFSSRESSRPRLLLLDDDDLPKKLYYWVLCKSDLKHLNFCVSVAWFPFFALLWPRGQKLTPENYLFTFFPSLSPFFLFLSTPNIWRYIFHSNWNQSIYILHILTLGLLHTKWIIAKSISKSW